MNENYLDGNDIIIESWRGKPRVKGLYEAGKCGN